MKNKIITILLSLLMVLSTTNIAFAADGNLVVHYKYLGINAVEKTGSVTISKGGSKLISKIVTIPKNVSDNNYEYTYEGNWIIDGDPKADTERIYNSDYDKDEIYAEAVQVKKAIPIATIYIKYLDREAGWQTKKVNSNPVKSGNSWKVTQKTLDDDIDYNKQFDYQGKSYTFTGWDKELPLTIKGITEDTDYYFTAQYTTKDIKKFKATYTDKVANGSGSWSNLDENGYPSSFTDYTKTFKKPADIPDHYTFLYWEKGDKTWKAGDKYTRLYEDIAPDEKVEFIATYEYQPPLIIKYHYNEDDIYTVKSYEDVNIYDAAPEKLKWFYDGENEPISEDEIATIPDSYVVQDETDDAKVIHVYAKYFTINWLDDNGETLDTSEMVPYGEIPEYKGETPTKEATPQYTYKFLGWTPDVEPATENKDYTAVYNEITNIYTITFIDYDGTLLSQADYPYGTPAAEIEKPIPTREPTIKYTYIFAGWDPEVQDVTEDATYTATWEEQEIPPEDPEDPDEPEEPEDPDEPEDEPEKEKEKPKDKQKVTSAPSTFGGWIPTNEPSVDDEEDETETRHVNEMRAPKGLGQNEKYWALINLICVILSALFALISLFIKRKKYEDEDLQKKEKRKKLILKIIGVILFICGIVLFILTEDMTATMTLIDKWTLLNVLLFINNLLAFFILIDSKKEDEEEDKEEEEE